MNLAVANRPMVTELAGRKPFRVGNATIDPLSRDVRWEGGQERLQPLTLKVLLVLRSRSGEVVTRDELTQLCWDGRVIGDDVINRSISLLRHFAEHAGGFRIDTVPRAGYRLIEHGAGQRAGRFFWAIGGLAMVVAVAGGAYLGRRQPSVPTAMLAVAVRPFTAPSGDSLATDLAARADDATSRMLNESGVSVIDVNGADRPNDADLILSGSAEPTARGQVVTIRVEDAVHHSIVMTRRIEATPADPEDLPDQVGAQVASALSTAAPLIRLDRAYPSDPALLASLLNSASSTFEAQRNFEIAKRTAPNAPNSAIAQLGLAMSTGLNMGATPALERAAVLAAGREAATRLLRVAPQFGDSYVPWCYLHAEVRIAECESELEKGMAVDPRAQSVGIILGKLLINVGRLNEAVPIEKTTLAKNPYRVAPTVILLLALDASGQSHDADMLFKQARRLRPKSNDLFLYRASGMLGRGDFDALSKFDDEITASGVAPNYKSIARPLARAIRDGSRSQAQATCRTAPYDDNLQMLECMLALARLGDLDKSFEFANRLYPRRTGRTTEEEDGLWLANPDNLDTLYLTGAGAAPMRRDARFLGLADRVGLIRYWRRTAMPDFCTHAHEPICARIARG